MNQCSLCGHPTNTGQPPLEFNRSAFTHERGGAFYGGCSGERLKLHFCGRCSERVVTMLGVMCMLDGGELKIAYEDFEE